jgi:UDP-glucose 4-epimerase
MSVLIAGGGGFIGSHLARRLAELGEKVVILDPSPNPQLLRNRDYPIELVRGDATQIGDILQAVKQHAVQDVYHLIALLGDVSQEKPLWALKINVETLVNVLEVARLMGLGKVIFASSVAVYGIHEPAPVGEDAPLNPASVYGATKVMGEFYGLHYYRQFKVDFRALRFTTLYGPGKSAGATGICSLLIEKPARGEPIQGDAADAVTDWLYIKDAIESLILARTIDQPRSRVYNIGAGSYSLRQVAAVVKRFLPQARIDLEAKRTFPWPPSYKWERARSELGYQPRYDIEAGVKDFIAEVQKNKGS